MGLTDDNVNIAALVNEKIITDITAVRDESDENTRVVIEVKRDAIPKVVINNLFKHTAARAIRSSPMTYKANGRQYVTIVASNMVLTFGLP